MIVQGKSFTGPHNWEDKSLGLTIEVDHVIIPERTLSVRQQLILFQVSHGIWTSNILGSLHGTHVGDAGQ